VTSFTKFFNRPLHADERHPEDPCQVALCDDAHDVELARHHAKRWQILLIMDGDRQAIEIHDPAVFLLEGQLRRDFGHSRGKHGELQLA
jgi:hypothetical protein